MSDAAGDGVRLRRSRRLRSFKRVRMVLLVCGGTMLVLGVGLLLMAVVQRNERWQRLGAGYLVGGGGVLAIRSAGMHVDRYRKRKYVKR